MGDAQVILVESESSCSQCETFSLDDVGDSAMLPIKVSVEFTLPMEQDIIEFEIYEGNHMEKRSTRWRPPHIALQRWRRKREKMLIDQNEIDDYVWWIGRVRARFKRRKMRPPAWGKCEMCELIGYMCHPCALRVEDMWAPARGEDPDWDSDSE